MLWSANPPHATSICDTVSTAQSQGQVRDIATPLRNPWSVILSSDRILLFIAFNAENSQGANCGACLIPRYDLLKVDFSIILPSLLCSSNWPLSTSYDVLHTSDRICRFIIDLSPSWKSRTGPRRVPVTMYSPFGLHLIVHQRKCYCQLIGKAAKQRLRRNSKWALQVRTYGRVPQI